jgi:hypothetical protein
MIMPYKWTLTYIAIIVTVLLVLQLVDHGVIGGS